MGNFRFWRRIKIFPGTYLNISKSGVSISFGPRGLTLTLGKNGVRFTAGLSGTGLFYTHHTSKDNIKQHFEKLKKKEAELTEGEVKLLKNHQYNER